MRWLLLVLFVLGCKAQPEYEQVEFNDDAERSAYRYGFAEGIIESTPSGGMTDLHSVVHVVSDDSDIGNQYFWACYRILQVDKPALLGAALLRCRGLDYRCIRILDTPTIESNVPETCEVVLANGSTPYRRERVKEQTK